MAKPRQSWGLDFAYHAYLPVNGLFTSSSYCRICLNQGSFPRIAQRAKLTRHFPQKEAFRIAAVPDFGPADSSTLLSQAASLVSLGAWSCDLGTEQLSWTQGVFDIFGWSSKEVPDRRCAVEMYCEESRELLERKRSRAIETGSQFSLDARIFRLDGSARWIRITAATRSFNGRARSLYGMKQDITADHERWEKLRAQAECDSLTGLANRAPFQRFLEQPRRSPTLKSTGALLLFDLDGFKQVNDWWGHAAGDACLVAFAERLRVAFRRAELIARIGGDEFAVLLPTLQSRAGTQAEISLLVTKLLAPVRWDGKLLPLGASAGLAFAAPSGDFDPQGLFTEADRSLYNAKESASSHLVCA